MDWEWTWVELCCGEVVVVNTLRCTEMIRWIWKNDSFERTDPCCFAYTGFDSMIVLFRCENGVWAGLVLYV